MMMHAWHASFVLLVLSVRHWRPCLVPPSAGFNQQTAALSGSIFSPLSVLPLIEYQLTQINYIIGFLNRWRVMSGDAPTAGLIGGFGSASPAADPEVTALLTKMKPEVEKVRKGIE